MSESKSDEESREEGPDTSDDDDDDDDDDVRVEQVEDAMEQKDTALRHHIVVRQASKNEGLFCQD